MITSEIGRFAQRLATLEKTQVELAIALLWFEDKRAPGAEVSVAALAGQLHDVGLASAINRTRLASQLARQQSVVRGKTANTFKLAMQTRKALDAEYLPMLENPPVEVRDSLLPARLVAGTRGYLEAMVQEINGCYQCGFYDGCAALSRRLVESLLIDAFAKAGHSDKIRDADGNYKMLAGVIREAKSRKYVAVSRTAPDSLDMVKEVGDRAAHDKVYITTRQDIDAMQFGLRALVAELLVLADIHPRAPSAA